MKTGTMVKALLLAVALTAVCYYFLDTLKPTAIVAVVKTGVAPNSVPGTVRVRAKKEMDIRSDLAGRVIESKLELGMQVKEGALLIALDLGDLELQIEKLKIEIKAANLVRESGSRRQFDLIAAREKLEDVKRRREIGGASQADVTARERVVRETEQAIQNEINSMELQVAQLENGLKGLERQIGKMSLRAPIDGVITQVYAYRGDLIGSGEEIAKIMSLDRIVEVQISEENFSGVEVGQIVRVKFLGYGEDAFDAVVSKTLPVADPTTQRYTVHIDVDVEREKLFPGLTGEARITLDERANSMLIPASAIIGNRVFLVEAGKVSVRHVEKGYSSMTLVEVRSGLGEGDQIIVDKLELFKEGDSVRTEEKKF